MIWLLWMLLFWAVFKSTANSLIIADRAYVVDLLSTLAWPVVALVGLVLLREPLGRLVEEVGQRATKVSVFQFAVELSTVPQLAPPWKVGANDVRQLTRADVFDAPTMGLFQQLSSPGASDYIVVDLGCGDQWLSSRLYIFALVLQRMRGLRCVVFTATRQEETGVFIGLAEPSRVRWSLAIAYPWLESAFARAYAQASPPRPSPTEPPPPAPAPAPATTFVVSQEGALPPEVANHLVRMFLTELQFPQPGQFAPTVAPPPPQPPDEWIVLPPSPQQQQAWEHATWLTSSLLEQVLGRSALDWESAFEDSPDLPTEERAQAIARRPGAFIPLVTRTGRFKGLVDRRSLLEAIARDYAEPK